MYQLAIFDLDGTLLDTLADLRQGLNYALATQGFAPRTLPEVRAFVGNGIRKLIERAVPAGTGEAQIDAVFEAFHPYYAVHCVDFTKPYPGIWTCCGNFRRTASSLPSSPTSRIMP